MALFDLTSSWVTGRCCERPRAATPATARRAASRSNTGCSATRLAARSRLDLDGGPVASDGVSGPEPVLHGIPFRLTRREQDVLERLTVGRTNREIATDLFISEKTASVHVSNIKSKLGANGRAEIAAIAVRLGLVGEPTDA